MSWLNCFKVDIVCLQETHSCSETEFDNWFSNNNVNINNKRKYKIISSPGTIRSSGVAILYNPKYRLVHSWRDTAGRLLTAEFNFGNLNFQIACLYGPNNRNDGQLFFESFYQALNPNLPVLLCGDFNTTPNPHLDRFGCNPTSPWAYNWLSTLNDLMNTYELGDAWRTKNPEAREFTWNRPNGSQGSRIDMIWVPMRYLGLISSVGIFPFFRSDHSYVYIKIDLPFNIDRGKGLWKFNTAHLKDESFCSEIVQFWTDWRSEQARFSTLSSWWDAGKARLKKLICQLSRKSSGAAKQNIKRLNDSLVTLQQQSDNEGNTSILLEAAKAELISALETEARGAQIRARVQWAEEGEKSTKYFLRQEKIRGQHRLISAIRRSDGSVAKSTKEISAVWRDYYFQLFSAQPLISEDQENFINSLERHLSPADAELCEGPLTLSECHAALLKMPHNKSPGVDGLPAEFYLKFWDILGDDLVNVFNECFEIGQLSLTQCTGAITLLYKKGDVLNTANWRPITLLCCDYKIATKALCNRLLNVIGLVVSPDQSCGIPGRFMGENVRLLQDICDYSHDEAIPAAIISLDQEKAFDRVEWQFMEKVLVKMGFGPSFRKWIGLMYSCVYSKVIVNGHLTEAFPVSRGVRQGCPLSPLLYVLVAETMACRVRADNHIDGFPLPCSSKHVKISQYADDTTILVRSDFSIKALFELFEGYERASGARLNMQKCWGLLLGPWRSRSPDSMPVQIRWSNTITVLGSQLSPGGTQDWGPLIGKLSSIVSTWKKRDLSFRGRALVVNTLGLSTLWYLSSLCSVPQTTISQINHIVFPFVWNKKREWLSRSSVTQPLHQGGLAVIDVYLKISSLAILWVKRYLLGPDHPWKYFFRFFLRRAMLAEPVDRIFCQSTIGSSTLRKLPSFYQDVIKAWLSVKGRKQNNTWIVPGHLSTSDMPLERLTAGSTYQLLCQLQQTLHRCQSKFPFVEWSTVWSNLSYLRYSRPALDTTWMSAHGILPTASRLIRFGMSVNPLCHCGQPETIEHIVFHCWVARDLINWLHQLLVKFSNCIPRPSVWEMLYGYRRVTRVPPGFIILIGIIKHQLWCARNKFRFEGIIPSLADMLERIKSAFRFDLRIHQRKTGPSLFKERWLVNGILGTVNSNGFISFAAELDSATASH